MALSKLQLGEQLLIKSGHSDLLQAARVLFHTVPCRHSKTDVLHKCATETLLAGS